MWLLIISGDCSRFEYNLSVEELRLRHLSVSVKNNSASFRSRDMIGQVSLRCSLALAPKLLYSWSWSVNLSSLWSRPSCSFRCRSSWRRLTWFLASLNGEHNPLNFLQTAFKTQMQWSAWINIRIQTWQTNPEAKPLHCCLSIHLVCFHNEYMSGQQRSVLSCRSVLFLWIFWVEFPFNVHSFSVCFLCQFKFPSVHSRFDLKDEAE